MGNYVDFKDKVVMDVGAGSGILSLFAAQVSWAYLPKPLLCLVAYDWKVLRVLCCRPEHAWCMQSRPQTWQAIAED